MDLFNIGVETGTLTIKVNNRELKALSVQQVEEFENARYGTSKQRVYIGVRYEITGFIRINITLKLYYCRDMT
jgi:hypothetical protein